MTTIDPTTIPGHKTSSLPFVGQVKGSEVTVAKSGKNYRASAGGPEGLGTLGDDGRQPIEEVAAEVQALVDADLESRLATVEEAQSAGMLGFETKALMDADLAHDAGTLALVTNDGTAANNGAYRKTGASGAGSWVLSADRVTGLESDVASLQAGVVMDHALLKARADLAAARAALGAGRPKAAVVILLGQSLNVSRGIKAQEKSWPGARMFVDAAAISEFTYFATNNEHCPNWASVASAIDYAEGTGQSPGVGIAATIGGGKFERAYICSAAIGARRIDILWQGGPRCALYATLHRLCEIARADGYDPIVMFYSAHGEADGAAGTSEETYYTRALGYYQMAQLAAAQAMEKPDYVAPVFLTYPVQQREGGGDYDRAIKEAIRRVAADLPNGVNLGSIYQWPCETDRVHPTPESYIKRGEMVGRAMRDYYEQGRRWGALHITDVTLSGTEFIATFSEPVVRDATLGVGENLNAALACDGLEWLDNGTGIAITALSYEGWKVRGTLATAPVGTISQQKLRIAAQTTTASVLAGVANLPGSLVRADAAGWKSVRDYTYTNYMWAAPQSCEVRSA